MDLYTMNWRKAGVDDVPLLCSIRKQQLLDEGIVPTVNIDQELEDYFATQLSNGNLVEWLVEDNGKIVATGAIVFMPFPPTWTNPSGMKGYITNMYTHPDYRKQGIATQMLKLLCEEARDRQVNKLWLGASKLGRPVYEAFGFEPTSEWLELDLNR